MNCSRCASQTSAFCPHCGTALTHGPAGLLAYLRNNAERVRQENDRLKSRGETDRRAMDALERRERIYQRWEGWRAWVEAKIKEQA